MRYIDIYKETDSGVEYVTGGCGQLGEPVIQRTPIVSSYTLADGTPVIYPAAKDTASMTVELDCTRAEAAAIETLIHGAHIILAGLKAGAVLGTDVQRAKDIPQLSGTPCIITGTAEIGEAFARSGIYYARFPVQLLTNTIGRPLSTSVPFVRVPTIYVNGAGEDMDAYFLEKRMWNGESVLFQSRKMVYWTRADSITIGYIRFGEEAVCYAYLDGQIIADSTETNGEFTFPLTKGAQHSIVLEFIGAACRPARIGITVRRVLY